jgi:DNA-binding response OmpR family regulator
MATLLVVASDPNVFNLINWQFSPAGVQVVGATRGDAGLEMALKVKPDLILLEAQMPDATGFQMCRKFRQTAETKSIPIVMISPLAKFDNQRDYAKERGANEIISKPLRVLELGDIVDRYIQPPRSSEARFDNGLPEALRHWLGGMAKNQHPYKKDNLPEI